MTIYALTDKGPNKSENEDRIIAGKSILAEGVITAETSKGLLANADGVGGNNAGAVASNFIATKLCTLNNIDIDELVAINKELIALSKDTSEYNGMATTLSGVYISEDNILLFNIGNTRTYLLQSRKYLKQLTSDDTTLNYLLATGQLTSETAKDFDKKNEITACFGGGMEELFKLKIDNMESVCSPIVITSDGIHDYVSVDQMEEIFKQYGVSLETCEVLKEAARIGGSRDDISIVIGDV